MHYRLEPMTFPAAPGAAAADPDHRRRLLAAPRADPPRSSLGRDERLFPYPTEGWEEKSRALLAELKSLREDPDAPFEYFDGGHTPDDGPDADDRRCRRTSARRGGSRASTRGATRGTAAPRDGRCCARAGSDRHGATEGRLMGVD
jgi:hypothetical protein